MRIENLNNYQLVDIQTKTEVLKNKHFLDVLLSGDLCIKQPTDEFFALSERMGSLVGRIQYTLFMVCALGAIAIKLILKS